MVKDLAGPEDEAKAKKQAQKAAKKQNKANEKLRQRLAAERKGANEANKENKVDDLGDVDEDALLTFAKKGKK